MSMFYPLLSSKATSESFSQFQYHFRSVSRSKDLCKDLKQYHFSSVSFVTKKQICLTVKCLFRHMRMSFKLCHVVKKFFYTNHVFRRQLDAQPGNAPCVNVLSFMDDLQDYPLIKNRVTRNNTDQLVDGTPDSVLMLL